MKNVKINHNKHNFFKQKGIVLVSTGLLVVTISCAFINSAKAFVDGFNGSANSNISLAAAVKENKDIPLQDKRIYAQLEPIIQDNQYVNKKKVIERVEKLDIDYSTPYEAPADDIDAYYNFAANQVTYYDYNQMSTPHEAMHVIYPCGNLPKFILEGTAITLSKEYFQEDITDYEIINYNILEASFKALCELLGEETIYKAIATNDYSVILNAMADIQGNKASAEQVLASIDNYEALSLIEALRPYYEAKYGKGWIENNEALNIYETNYYNVRTVEWPNKYYFNENEIKIK